MMADFFLASAGDDTAFAWAYYLAVPSAWLSLALYVPAGLTLIYAGIRRFLPLLPVLLGLLLPPVLTLLMVGCRDGPGWLFLLAVIALPAACAFLLWYALTARRRAANRR